MGASKVLVEQGFYANRAEFIHAAIHYQLDKHAETVRETSLREGLVIGAVTVGRAELERRRKSGKRFTVKVIGYVSIADDVMPALAKVNRPVRDRRERRRTTMA